MRLVAGEATEALPYYGQRYYEKWLGPEEEEEKEPARVAKL